MAGKEWILAAIVVICATVAAVLHALDPVAYAGILGATIGYTGKGVATAVKTEE